MPLNTVSLMGPNPAQPFDLQTQQAMLQRQSALAQALLAQSMQDHSPVVRTAVGNPFSRDVPNFGDPIASIAQAYMGRGQQDRLDQQQAGLASELQRRDVEDTGKVLQLRQGYMGTGEGPPTAEGDLPQQKVPGNFIAAVQAALGSTVPRVKAWGAEMAKDLPGPLDIAKIIQHIDPETARTFLETGDPGVLKAPVETKVEGGVVVGTRNGQVVAPPTPIDQRGPIVKESVSGAPGQFSKTTGAFHAVPPYGDISVEKNFENVNNATAMKEVEKGYGEYKAASANLGVLEQVKNDMKNVPEDAFGTLGNFRTGLGKVGELFGFDKLPSTANKEQIHSAMGNLTLEKVRALAPVTEEDVKMIQTIVGSEGNTKRALTQIVDVLQAATLRKMAQHEAFVKTTAGQSKNPELFYKQWVPEFSTTPVQANPLSTMSDSDLLKKLRSGN